MREIKVTIGDKEYGYIYINKTNFKRLRKHPDRFEILKYGDIFILNSSNKYMRIADKYERFEYYLNTYVLDAPKLKVFDMREQWQREFVESWILEHI